MRNKILFTAVLAIFFLSSCKKDRFEEPIAPQKMDEVRVPASFDWKTTKDIMVTFSTPTAGIVDVTNTQSVSYQKAFLIPGTDYTMKLTVPSYENSVKIRFNNEVSTLELSSTSLSFQFK